MRIVTLCWVVKGASHAIAGVGVDITLAELSLVTGGAETSSRFARWTGGTPEPDVVVAAHTATRIHIHVHPSVPMHAAAGMVRVSIGILESDGLSTHTLKRVSVLSDCREFCRLADLHTYLHCTH